jgi:hypothetical protein
MTKAGLGLRRAQKGPETIYDLGAGVPNDVELEPGGGVPHRLGEASEAGGVRLGLQVGGAARVHGPEIV